jgi:hypothetical protein
MKSSVFDNGVVELSILQSELAACRDVDDLHDAACGGGGACDGGLDMNSTSSSSSSSDQLLPGSDDMSNCSPVDSRSKQDSFDVVQVDDVVNDIVMVRDGAVDFRGRPSVKSRTGNWRACWIIFGQSCFLPLLSTPSSSASSWFLNQTATCNVLILCKTDHEFSILDC